MNELEHSEHASDSRWARGCATAAIVGVIVLAILFAIALFARKYNADQMEADRAKRRQNTFDKVKSGDEMALIFDSKALDLLASDADCVRNLKYLQCSSVDFTDADLTAAKKLVHIRSISFYDCTRAGNLLLEMRSMPSVEAIGWESSFIPDDAIRSLASFPNLKRISIEDIVNEPRERLLRESLPSVKLNIPYPAADEPK